MMVVCRVHINLPLPIYSISISSGCFCFCLLVGHFGARGSRQSKSNVVARTRITHLARSSLSPVTLSRFTLRVCRRTECHKDTNVDFIRFQFSKRDVVYILTVNVVAQVHNKSNCACCDGYFCLLACVTITPWDDDQERSGLQ
jgi:hypothetical protein